MSLNFRAHCIWWINIILAALSKYYSNKLRLPRKLHVGLKETPSLKNLRKILFQRKDNKLRINYVPFCLPALCH
jgi:hypothetical protein